MKTLPHTAYVLVGRCLAPVLSEGRKAILSRSLSRPEICWDDLLAEANRQQCLPLWYVRLEAHGFLDLLPGDLRQYLEHLTAANRRRNRRLRSELVEIAQELAANDIPVLLLKGAATFADDLYSNDGARSMQDLDLLIQDDQVERAQQILIDAGYVENPENMTRGETFPLNMRHSHLPPLQHPEKGAVVELHYKLSYGQSGRLMNSDAIWKAPLPGEIDGIKVRVLAPAQRLLHNAIDATLPHQAFLRGKIALKDLAEFAALWNRLGHAIERAAFFDIIDRHRLQSEFTTYARIAHLLMGTDFILSRDITTAIHTRRILKYGNRNQATGMAAFIGRAFSKAYYFTRLPRWAKQNVIYGDAGDSHWRRIWSLVSGLFNTHSSP